MDYRNDLERLMSDLCQDLLNDLWHPKWTRKKFEQIMGRIRTIRVKIQNKEYGCKTGAHQSECLCEDGIFQAINTLKNKRRGNTQ